jgi:hypothetical protein
MSTSRQVLGVCDVCGFRYKLRELRKNSYGLMVCPMDYEGQYNKQNHPQNNIPKSLDVETIKVPSRRSPMPPTTVTVTDWLPS